MALAFVCLGTMAQNSIQLNPEAKTIKYNPMLFGQFIEHFDNQIYGGIFDPGNPLSDEDGFRKDVIDAIRDIKTPIVRWPGGCFVSSYHWLDGIGPERIPVYDKTWHVEDPNTFGTDEYIKWCRKIGCEPYICTNAGTGTAEEMSDWVEYCNLTMGKWGRLRAQYGHPEPYNVKYWSVGNENWAPNELGAKSAEEWGPLVRESSKLMRAVTKDAKLFAAATSKDSWTLPLLKEAGWNLDYISIHGYWDPLWAVNNVSPYMKCMMKTDGPEAEILKTIAILDQAGFGDGKIKIAYDEWNLRGWHHPVHGDLRNGFDLAARRKNDINSTYTMSDAVFAACFLNTCLRHSDIVDIACFSPIVNTRGPIFVHKNGIVKRTTYWVFYLYANDLLPIMQPISLSSDKLTYEGQSTNVLDAVLTTNEAHDQYVLAIANKDPKKEQTISIDFKALGKNRVKEVQAKVLAGKSTDDYNDIGAENRVTPQECKLKVKNGSVTVPAHSVTIIFLN